MENKNSMVKLICEGGPDDGTTITVAPSEIKAGVLTCDARGRYYGEWDGKSETAKLTYLADPLGPSIGSE